MSQDSSFDAHEDEILQSVQVAEDAHSSHERQRAVKLLRWCAERDIYWDDRIAIHIIPHKDHDYRSIRVRAGQTIGPGDLLLACPKGALFSVQTCYLAQQKSEDPVVQELRKGSLSPTATLGLDLAYCLLAEFCLGPDSAYWGYLQSLPLKVDLPYFWEKDDKRLWWLHGTEAERLLERIRGTEREVSSRVLRAFLMEDRATLLRSFCRSYVQPHDAPRSTVPDPDTLSPSLRELHLNLSALLNDHNLLLLFQKAFCLVSSRAFVVDLYHGLALCPIADILNHEEENHAHLEVDDAVCARCGRLLALGCLHSTADLSQTTQEQIHEDPVLLRCVASVPSEEEVFNTYGRLSNAELILRYGFALELVTDNDRLTWDPFTKAERLKLCETFTIDPFDLFDELQRNRSKSKEHSPADPQTSAMRLLFNDGERLSIDGEGRISTSLWRLALGHCMRTESVGDELFDEYFIRLSEIQATSRREIDPRMRRILLFTLRKLQRLIDERSCAIEIRSDAERETAFELLEASTEPSLISVVRVAEQSYSALGRAQDEVRACLAVFYVGALRTL